MGLSHTVSGSVAHFRTPSRVPIESLKLHFLPKQEGSGDPSPSNIRPITGWKYINPHKQGKNLINPASYSFSTKEQNGLTYTVLEDGTIRVQGTATASDTGPGLTGRFKLPPGTYHGYKDEGNVYVTYRKATAMTGGSTSGLPNPFTITENDWMYCNLYVSQIGTFDVILHPQIEKGSVQTAYEQYKQDDEISPVVVSTVGKNLINCHDPKKHVIQFIQNGETFTNDVADTRTSGQLFIVAYCGNTMINNIGTINKISSTGPISCTFTTTDVLVKNMDNLLIKHNGITHDFRIYFPLKLKANTTYTFSANILGADPTTVGGFIIKDIQIEEGETATAYEKYNSDVYGGYVDITSGEIWKTWHGVEASTLNWQQSSQFERQVYIANLNDSQDPVANNININNIICNSYKTISANITTSEMDDGIKRHKNQIASNYLYIRDTRYTTLSDFISNVDAFIVYEIETPILVATLSSTELKAFLDHNNFWSDANDITEVTYAVVESKDMFDARKRIMSKTWNMLPLPYTEVEYISAKNSNPYIDMGIYFTDEMEAEVHYYNDKSEAFLFGARKGSGNTPYCNFNIEGSSTNRSRFDYADTKAVATGGLVFNGVHDGEYIFKFHNRIATVENVSTGTVVTSDYSSCRFMSYSDYSMLLFAVMTNGSASLSNNSGELRIYSAKFWIGGQLVRDLVPCFRKSDNKPGMYDRVSKTFFTNAGSGEFSLPA